MVIYKYKMPGLFPVPAQTAGEELERIYSKNGRLDPGDIVDESRPADAPLHACFEWDDTVAAEKYRKSQAGDIIRAIVTVAEDEEHNTQEMKVEIRAFGHVEHTYHPMSVIVQDEDKFKELMRSAMNDMASFKKRYSQLSKLKPVIQEMDKLLSDPNATSDAA